MSNAGQVLRSVVESISNDCSLVVGGMLGPVTIVGTIEEVGRS